MKKLIFMVMFFTLASTAGLAQTKERQAWGYLFAGAGGSSDGVALWQVGGGGDGLMHKGLGIGGELSVIAAGDGGSGGVGVASVNLSGHFNRANKAQPFITGGATVAFSIGAAGGGNVGGGVQYWFKDRVGLRIEARDYIFSSDRYNLFLVRVGISFR
ncbi:MAG: hypothetical protein AB1757_28595 [Acidobacteriota bacterium]